MEGTCSMKTRQASTFPWQVLGYSLHTAQFHCSSAEMLILTGIKRAWQGVVHTYTTCTYHLTGTCTSASVRLGAKLGNKSIDITQSSLITVSPNTLTPGLRFDWISTQCRDLLRILHHLHDQVLASLLAKSMPPNAVCQLGRQVLWARE